MITSNVIQRVFRLKYKASAGTCFSIDVEGKQYLVTARHVLQIKDTDGKVIDEFKTGEAVELLQDNKWISQLGTLVGHSDTADVSVFTIPTNIPAHPLPATMEGFTYGQELYFLGFPYGLKSDVGTLNRNFPLPFVKKGILSAMFFNDPGKFFFIDGHNNPGFSGGPVVFKEVNTNEFKVAGIIHGYQPEYEEKGGNLVPIQNTNSGIIKAYSINNAIDIISQNNSSKSDPRASIIENK